MRYIIAIWDLTTWMVCPYIDCPVSLFLLVHVTYRMLLQRLGNNLDFYLVGCIILSYRHLRLGSFKIALVGLYSGRSNHQAKLLKLIREVW